MIILIENLPMWLVLVFICLFATPTLSQPDFINSFCEPAATYTRDSTFEKNLNTTLSVLSNTNSGLGFYNYSTGHDNDTVNSIALCRGDVNPDVCQSCLSGAIDFLRQDCPNQKEATAFYDHCLLKYSDQTLLREGQPKPLYFLWSEFNSTDPDRFNTALRLLLNDLVAEAAAGGSLRKFATGSRPASDNTTIYGLVQCTPDLISKQCSDCLIDVINKALNCSYSGRTGGRYLLPMCNFRYETNQWFNRSNQAIPTPPSRLPAPSPNLQVSPPSPAASPNLHTSLNRRRNLSKNRMSINTKMSKMYHNIRTCKEKKCNFISLQR